ncbi:RidA family protein [Oceaniovalibus sp. ACAM 378]|jgi:enamine deaminase RidA (YjgF/YER057c/UK114 family)|uniref:RidA family protein n=1 Tax=Oceaniovalibus sp. ACAM 378 TaxID=2599923 RepID=UPI0011D4B2F3|nr:RidA family protein [Oceaniovalibus sp. ACAM 378]TYB84312.1 RidA family protein [Oceaniovalibus sp. ACAM 378]
MTISQQSTDPMANLAAMGLTLPECPPSPIGAFCNIREHKGYLYVSGQGPIDADGVAMVGKVGGDVSAEQAREHARLVALNILAVVRHHLGGFARVHSVLKVLGLVNAVPDFERHPFVIDGASELFHGVFGERGVHSRSSFGVSSLPNRITVEIEAILTLTDNT